MIDYFRAFLKQRKLDHNYRHKIHTLQKRLNIVIQNPQLFLRALRHRSFLIENKLAPIESYEQLEFIGDAVLDLVVSEIILNRYPDAAEGQMTKIRSRLVNGEMLAYIARNIQIHKIIELGERVKNQGIEGSVNVLSDVFEALIGAIYLDQGYDKCRSIICTLFDENVLYDEIVSLENNYKSILLEFTQAKKLPPPVYAITGENGPDHNKTFEIKVTINEDVFGNGVGKNKKSAEQEAARKALSVLNKIYKPSS